MKNCIMLLAVASLCCFATESNALSYYSDYGSDSIDFTRYYSDAEKYDSTDYESKDSESFEGFTTFSWSPYGDDSEKEDYTYKTTSFNTYYGTQCGGYTSGGDYTAPAPVPEPSTILLFGAGLFGITALRKKIAQ